MRKCKTCKSEKNPETKFYGNSNVCKKCTGYKHEHANKPKETFCVCGKLINHPNPKLRHPRCSKCDALVHNVELCQFCEKGGIWAKNEANNPMYK